MEGTESLPTIVVPGPELCGKVDTFAARLSTLDRRKADEIVAKVLASNKRNQFLFVDTSHIFYPYFLSKVTEYRQFPERRPQKPGDGQEEETSGSAAASGVTTTTKTGGVTRTTGGTAGVANDPKREELLRQTEAEARRYLEDPFPNHYSLDLRGGTVDVRALLMDILSTTAQYTAKYGDKFLAAVQSKQTTNSLFRFLQEDDVRHEVFQRLVESYRRILNYNAEETEARLELLQSQDYVLQTVVAEKKKYASAALARRRAALLTDDELRSKLQWNTFTVVNSFRLSDLQLDGPMPVAAASQQSVASPTPAAVAASSELAPATQPPDGVPATVPRLQPPGQPPAFAPVYMSSNLVHGSKEKRNGAFNSSAADPTAVDL